MKQFHDLINTIIKEGVYKEQARENMPRTKAIFGHQMRFNLNDGFPILTTKKVSFKHIIIEILWFLKGETNIKFLVDNNCNIWNEDAYNYYVKIIKKFSNQTEEPPFSLLVDDPNQNKLRLLTFDEFVNSIRENRILTYADYKLGDAGKQYGWLWREWGSDQLKKLIKNLNSNPESRRHIISAWNPATLDDMALNACHSFVQFNCRPLSLEEKINYVMNNYDLPLENLIITEFALDHNKTPSYYLDCQLYQRSGDAFLGIPYNISSYALLTHIIAKLCNMQVGNFIHTLGDAHLYENHMSAVEELLIRDYNLYKLPNLIFSDSFNTKLSCYKNNEIDLDDFFNNLDIYDFSLDNYQSYSAIKAELSTGLLK